MPSDNTVNHSASAHQPTDRAITYRPGWLWFGLWTFLCVSILGVAVDAVVDGRLAAGTGTEGLLERGLGWALVGCAVAVTPLVVGMMVVFASSSARLQGTTLVVRRGRTQRIDLSTATVSVSHALVARDAVNPKGIMVPLVVPLRGVLPADELTALAHAVQPGPAARALLDLATNPDARRRAGRTTRILKVALGITLGSGALALISLGVLELVW